MALPVWGNLEKSQIDPEKIEEAIARLIQAHEDDPNAHVEAGESLQSHKASEIIDHIVASIVADKIKPGEIDISKLTWGKEILLCVFESIDGFVTLTQGSAAIQNFVGFVKLSDSHVLNDVVAMWGQREERHLDCAGNPMFQTVARFSSANLKYIVSGGRPLAAPGNYFGFKSVGTDLFACHYLTDTEYTTEITGIDIIQWHTYRCVYTSGEKIEFYVDGVLKATHTENLPTGENIIWIYFGSKNVDDAPYAAIKLMNLYFMQDY